jgi:formylglycine-generating enzyme required for sulfatase activity
VTVAQFLKFHKDHDHEGYKQYAPTVDCPVMMISWHDAAAYCNWVSKAEGIAEGQWCYKQKEKGAYEPAANHLQRTGYRLATEAEWEYACRAGADSEYCYGDPVELLGKYAWYDATSLGKSHPAGALKPNDLGLFDMHLYFP